MNCPSRNDETLEHEDWNQSPSALSAGLTTREDLNGIVNRRTKQDFGVEAEDGRTEPQKDLVAERSEPPRSATRVQSTDSGGNNRRHGISFLDTHLFPSFGHRGPFRSVPEEFVSFPRLQIENTPSTAPTNSSPSQTSGGLPKRAHNFVLTIGKALRKYLGFVGPGFMVAVAYIDPGNYSTDVSAGVATRFKLLFIVLMSNIFAIVLQSLAIRLGTVTGMDLAQHCRAHLPRWLNLFLYALGEAAIIATDIAEVG